MIYADFGNMQPARQRAPGKQQVAGFCVLECDSFIRPNGERGGTCFAKHPRRDIDGHFLCRVLIDCADDIGI